MFVCAFHDIIQLWPEGASVALVGEGASLALGVQPGQHLKGEGCRLREGVVVLLVGACAREDGLRLGVLPEPLAALGQEESVLGRLGAVLRQQVVRLRHAVGPAKVARFVRDTQRKTCDLAFFRLCQNILLMSILRYQKILLAANTRDIYEQLSLITFFVSGYFGI